MPTFGSISRRDLIKNLKRLGFVGPYSSKRHQYMVREENKVYIPNPHQGDISKGLLLKVLSEAGVSREEWEDL
ncbi:MAG: type II toxin-antitoxin system HicA family toxin [Timaviella obliquedivisa GSE-PSE-MK23-08B]|jgi:predicted RNA binding protein YcfA (HicA-like mRNA interferase family)|nr:type II toxin-antitoxin system HicA family toxin [Timaviella obliquedivisa GSE-PSE-MK23-08B]